MAPGPTPSAAHFYPSPSLFPGFTEIPRFPSPAFPNRPGTLPKLSTDSPDYIADGLRHIGRDLVSSGGSSGDEVSVQGNTDDGSALYGSRSRDWWRGFGDGVGVCLVIGLAFVAVGLGVLWWVTRRRRSLLKEMREEEVVVVEGCGGCAGERRSLGAGRFEV